MAFVASGQSKWTFVTYGSVGGAGGALLQIGANAGTITLADPSSTNNTYWYAGVGGGVGFGGKIKLGKVNIKLPGSGSLGPTALPSTGIVYLNANLNGVEPVASDLRGPCTYMEIGAGLIAGGSVTAMMLGGSAAWFAGALAAGPLAGVAFDQFYSSCKLMVLMAGLNAGVQAGGGIMAYLGGII